MRIGIDYTTAAQEGAGIGRFTRELVAALLAEGPQHEYVFLAPRGSRPPFVVASCPQARWAALPVSARAAAVFWQRARLPVPVEWFTGPLDIFHATDYVLPPLRAAQGVVTIHDLSFLRHPEYAEPSLARYLLGAVPRALERARLVLADSEFTKEELVTCLGLPPERVAVVYGGVSDAFHPVEDPETRADLQRRYQLPKDYLLTVCRLEPRKNLPGVLRAYRVLLDRGVTVMPLAIGGSRGWGYGPIFQTVADLGLERHVRFLGYVPEQDLPPLLSGAAAFLYPSFYEGFGLPPLEAMACGTPVVASNVASLPEVLGDAALLVAPADTEGIADAISRLVRDAGLRERLRQQGLARARRFSWAAAARQLLAAYQQAGAPAALATSR
ncbi:MAG: glycosyltransferase family 4 protein [Chloroflexi bacterium]|nr:glycosyltransferase family 4 protein [Chloroflexota bacterium]